MFPKNNEELAIIHENPLSSPSSRQMELDTLLALANKLLKKLPYKHKLTLSLEEILAPREQKKNAKNQPRPQNRFILFRKEYIAYAKKQDPARTRSICINEISNEASQHWKTLPPQVKRLFTILAKIADKRHKLMYPDYVYKPQKKESKQTSSEEQTSYEKSISSNRVNEILEFEEYINYNECCY
ncbi:16945_t:CDS:1 [Dentiscutata heterogama]|uniref:16945_t:CDS:1 n=1 Tax=Dentiscutata heterogama TaxID=1316150 RepID=A0ACA9MES1_9GLOM|nr:16945_t:CDS:1 [Dentiscutata heterogama]